MGDFTRKILFGGGIFFDLCKWVIFVGVVVILIHKFWMTVFVVDGLSMESTIHDKEFLVLKRYSSVKTVPKRGDVVAVKYPGDPDNKKYLKRVVGMLSDKVKIEGGKVYINGVVLRESYIPFGVETAPDGAWNLSDKEYFLMGDNRPGSNDSRYFGPVEKRFLIGQAIYIIYPRFQSVNSL
jgi:signal peptidase I